MLFRPFRWPEAVWVVIGAYLLVVTGALPALAAWQAIWRGLDVYLFLIGMMLLSEIARCTGLFDWLAALAVDYANGSPRRLFILLYAAGILVTAVLSNDAAAVVLTPAVFSATRRARVEPLPYLFICAFIANAASFVLPISNPANLVLYGDHMPTLGLWLQRFALPSLLAIGATYLSLRWVCAPALCEHCACPAERPVLGLGGRTALAAIALTAVLLLTVSALDLPLGACTCALGILTAIVVGIRQREAPWATLKGISWSILPLVAGLFVLVAGLANTRLLTTLAIRLAAAAQASVNGTGLLAASVLALVCNGINNLPAGLIASATIAQAHPPQPVVDALLIGVDLGPNLSITGSLATILWLSAIRREGQDIGFWRFIKVGAIVTPPALLLAIGARLFFRLATSSSCRRHDDQRH